MWHEHEGNGQQYKRNATQVIGFLYSYHIFLYTRDSGKLVIGAYAAATLLRAAEHFGIWNKYYIGWLPYMS